MLYEDLNSLFPSGDNVVKPVSQYKLLNYCGTCTFSVIDEESRNFGTGSLHKGQDSVILKYVCINICTVLTHYGKALTLRSNVSYTLRY